MFAIFYTGFYGLYGFTPYWNDPRIHNMGNGKVHASLARIATDTIDVLSYNGIPLRKQVLENHTTPEDTVVDLCCGTGTSTKYDSVGVDTSTAMIREATWRRGKRGTFHVGNAETWGETNEFDIATLFFALHEIPRDARQRILGNAMRIARKKVIVCDISPQKQASHAMLSGEPYLLEYQKHLIEDLKSCDDSTVALHELIPNRVLVCILKL